MAQISRFGRSYIGEPDSIAEEFAEERRYTSGRHDPPHGSQPAGRRLEKPCCSRRSPGTSRARSPRRRTADRAVVQSQRPAISAQRELPHLEEVVEEGESAETG